MASTVEERLALLEARLSRVEDRLDHSQYPELGVSIEEAKAIVREPAERGPAELEQLRRFLGSFEGPEDLSEHMRDYLYGWRDNGDGQ